MAGLLTYAGQQIPASRKEDSCIVLIHREPQDKFLPLSTGMREERQLHSTSNPAKCFSCAAKGGKARWSTRYYSGLSFLRAGKTRLSQENRMSYRCRYEMPAGSLSPKGSWK